MKQDDSQENIAHEFDLMELQGRFPISIRGYGDSFFGYNCQRLNQTYSFAGEDGDWLYARPSEKSIELLLLSPGGDDYWNLDKRPSPGFFNSNTLSMRHYDGMRALFRSIDQHGGLHFSHWGIEFVLRGPRIWGRRSFDRDFGNKYLLDGFDRSGTWFSGEGQQLFIPSDFDSYLR
jgi:hypothetical protein